MELIISLAQTLLFGFSVGFTIHALNTKKFADTVIAAWWWTSFWILFRVV